MLLSIKYENSDLSLDETLIFNLKIKQLILNWTANESGAVEIDVEQNRRSLIQHLNLKIVLQIGI